MADYQHYIDYISTFAMPTEPVRTAAQMSEWLRAELKMDRRAMEAALAKGGSVMYHRTVISRVENLPSEEEIALDLPAGRLRVAAPRQSARIAVYVERVFFYVYAPSEDLGRYVERDRAGRLLVKQRGEYRPDGSTIPLDNSSDRRVRVRLSASGIETLDRQRGEGSINPPVISARSPPN